MSDDETPELPPKQVRCNGCREWIDARARTCYLCGTDRPEVNVALINAVHAEKVNSHLISEATAARRDHAATRAIPQGAHGTGPAGAAHRGARGYDSLVNRFKQNLREAGAFE